MLNCEVFASDISNLAINLAKKNSELNNTNVSFIESDLFEKIGNKKFDIIVSNPPYIEDEKTIDPQVFKYEPKSALIAEPKTYFYEEILKNAKSHLNDEFIIAFEIGENMVEELMDIVDKYLPGSNYYFVKDIYQKDRFLYILKGE